MQQKKVIMPTPGKLELTMKINEFPAEVQTIENGLKQFDILAGGTDSYSHPQGEGV